MVLLYEKKGRVAYFTLNRPDALNSLNPELAQELSKAMVDFREDPQLWVGIVTGAGDRAFSAGADIKQLLPFMKDQWGPRPWLMPPNPMRGLELYKPLVAAVNGHALGGGLELALVCDIRIAAEHATFGVPEVRLGLIPGWGGTSRLPHLLPKAIAAQMLLTGQAISAQEAHRLGLINEVVPKDKLMETAERWAQRLAEPGPLAVRAAKEVMLKTMSMTLEESLKLEWEKIMYLYTTADWEEGREAFISRRKANFQAK